MVYVSDGTLTTDKRTIDDSDGWDTQTEWEAYQSKNNVVINSGVLELAQQSDTVIDDFEDGDLSEWTTGSQHSIVQSPVYEGTYAMEDGSGDGNDAYRDITADTYTNMRIVTQVDTFGGSTPTFFLQESTTMGPRIRVHSSGNVWYYDGSTWTDTGISLNTGAWYEIGMVNIDYSNNTYDIEVFDGTGSSVGSYTGADFENSISQIDRIRLADFDSNVYWIDYIHYVA